MLRLGFAGVLVLVSGLNDLTFYYLVRLAGRPAGPADWASHIAVFVGGPPTPTVAIVFCAVHLAARRRVDPVSWPLQALGKLPRTRRLTGSAVLTRHRRRPYQSRLSSRRVTFIACRIAWSMSM